MKIKLVIFLHKQEPPGHTKVAKQLKTQFTFCHFFLTTAQTEEKTARNVISTATNTNYLSKMQQSVNKYCYFFAGISTGEENKTFVMLHLFVLVSHFFIFKRESYFGQITALSITFSRTQVYHLKQTYWEFLSTMSCLNFL